MADGGVVAMVLYANLFNASTDACSREDWTIAPFESPPMTEAYRALYNSFMERTNSVLKNVARDFEGVAKKMTLVTSDWDPYVTTFKGRFCEEGASPVRIMLSNRDSASLQSGRIEDLTAAESHPSKQREPHVFQGDSGRFGRA
jgi:hypothetical protein